MKLFSRIFVLLLPLGLFAQFDPAQFKTYKESEPYKNLEWLTILNPNYADLNSVTNEKLIHEVKLIKSEKLNSRTGNAWERVNLFGGVNNNQQIRFSGRIRALDLNKDRLLIGAASGGLWQWTLNSNVAPVPIGEYQITSAAIGAIGSNPDNPKIILVGTGEPNISSGTGLWKSEDGGQTWKNINLGNFKPDAFTRITYVKSGLVFFSGSTGAYRSEDDGETWKQVKQGYQWDIYVDNKNTDVLFTAQHIGGVFKSTDAGKNWVRLGGAVLPTSNVGRVNISVSKNDANIIYANFTKSDNSTYGIFRSEDGGTTWRASLLQNRDGQTTTNIHNDQGWYDNMVAVAPNSKRCVVGGVQTLFSTSGTLFRENNLTRHSDIHCAAWSEDAKFVCIGTDGGLFIYEDNGTTLLHSNNLIANALPITQFSGIGTAKNDPDVIVGGAQDNGVIWRKNNVWFSQSGDGGAGAVDPTDSKYLFGSNGVYGDGLSFHPWVKTGDQPWDDRSGSLIYACNQWYTHTATDYNVPASVYYNACEYLFVTKDQGKTYTKINANEPLPGNTRIGHFGVSIGFNPKVYCGITDNNSINLMIYNSADQTFKNKSFAFQGSNGIWPRMFPSRSAENTVYAAFTGFGNGTNKKKIFRSTDGGENWTNISGNLPDVPVTCVLENPYASSQIYVATDGFGVFRTVDGGNTYERWDQDLPNNVKATTLDFSDETSNGGKFYVVLGTYGHSILRREIPKEELTATTDGTKPADVELIAIGNNVSQVLLKLKLNESGRLQFRINDLHGKEIFRSNEQVIDAGFSQNTIHVSLNTGMYLLQIIKDKKEVLTKKFFTNQ